MILQSLVDLDHRQRQTPGEAPTPEGHAKEKIGFGVLFDAEGAIVAVRDLRVPDAKNKLVPRVMDVPKPQKRTVNIAANLLWDKSSYALGLEPDDPKQGAKEREKRQVRLPQEHAAFIQRQREALIGTQDPGLAAFLRFLERWDRTAPDPMVLEYPDLLGSNIVFGLDGDRLWLHQREAALQLTALPEPGNGDGLCLVTGAAAAPARLHPAIKGVWGAQSAGASIVSFNLDAFESYGKAQGLNAPVSQAAADAYGRALNGLLERGSRRRVQIGDASAVFWAERDAPEEDGLLAMVFGAAADEEKAGDTVDQAATTQIEGIMNQLAAGRALRDAAPGLDPGVRYHVLGISPNAARLSIRFWLADSLGDLAARFGQHWQDLRIEPLPWRKPPGLWRLLVETAAQGKTENITKQLAGEVTRAILTGGRYPLSLLSAVIIRIRADGAINGMRAAIIKACLVRAGRIDHREEDPFVSRDIENPHPAYHLGRLFAVLESTQLTGLGDVNSTIRDRYYAAASSAPGSIFPLLVRNSNNHLKSVRTKKGSRLEGWFRKRIGQIIEKLDPQYPSHLDLKNQGRFSIGYYHEREAIFRKSDKDSPDELKDIDLSANSED